jgi:biopolymer transport protein ExbB/TolQ/DNA-directed RNA polymerase subunit RPC12/RpoP
MYFKFSCTKCGQSLKARKENVGKKARCPHCKTAVTVPAPPEPEPSLMMPDLASLNENQASASGQLPAGFPGASGLSSIGGKPEDSFASGSAASSMQMPAQGGETTTPAKGVRSSEADQTPGTDVNMLLTLLIGFASTVIWYLAVAMPLGDAYFGQLFTGRGWVPYAETLLFFWGLAQLIAKWRLIRRQRDSMLFDLLPNELGDDITTSNLRQFTSHIRSLPASTADSFLINRVLRGIEHFGVRKSASEVATAMSSQSDIDANGMYSSYTMLKFFIWAIPILGFIGTVIGIGAAVAGFGGALDNTEDVSQLINSLKDVTSGLGTAFDTTLVALVMGLILKFICDPMQKKEEDLLNGVDDYCNENLMKRLNDEGEGVSTLGGNAREIQKAINESMVPHHAEIQAWSEKLSAIGDALTARLTQGWNNIQKDVQEKHGQNMQAINEAVEAVVERQVDSLKQISDIQDMMSTLQDAQSAALSAKSEHHNEELKQILDAVIQRVDQAMDGIGDKSADAQQKMADTLVLTSKAMQESMQQTMHSMQQSSEALKTQFSALEQGLGGLNSVLEKLGQQNVVIQATVVQPKKKGWFGK